MSKYKDFEFTVTTPHGAVTFRCRAKIEAAAIAAPDRYQARANAVQRPLRERLTMRRLAG